MWQPENEAANFNVKQRGFLAGLPIFDCPLPVEDQERRVGAQFFAKKGHKNHKVKDLRSDGPPMADSN
jgi:hypothetical protein